MRCNTRILSEDSKGCSAYARTLGQEKLLVFLNASPSRRNLRVPVGELGFEDGRILHDLVGEGEYLVSGTDLAITLPGWSGVVLK